MPSPQEGLYLLQSFGQVEHVSLCEQTPLLLQFRLFLVGTAGFSRTGDVFGLLLGKLGLGTTFGLLGLLPPTLGVLGLLPPLGLFWAHTCMSMKQKTMHTCKISNLILNQKI